MQFVNRYKDIVRYTRKVLFTSFAITAIVDSIFLLLSFYIYLSINNLNRLPAISMLSLFTLFAMFCCIFCYILLLKRQELLLGLARFLEYIVYNNILKVGIFIDNSFCSSTTTKTLMKDVAVIRNIFHNDIISIMEIPFILCLLLFIFLFSETNGLTCIIYISFLILVIMIKQANKQKNRINNEVLENKTFFGQDLFDNSFKNYKYIHYNINIDKISQYYSHIDEARYENFLHVKAETIIYSSIIKLITLLFQITLVLNNIYLFVYQNIQLGSFILSICFIHQFLQKTSLIFQIISPALHIKKAINRIVKTIRDVSINVNYKIQEGGDISNCNEEKKSIEDEFLITAKDKSYYATDKNEIKLNNIQLDDNLFFSHNFYEGNVYVLNSNKYRHIHKIFETILNNVKNNKDKVIVSVKNNSYKDIFYCPVFPVILYGKILDIITNFEENVNTTKLKNIIDILNLRTDTKQLNSLLMTAINVENADDIDVAILKKINLASALYSNANILILEDPFIFLDKEAKNNLITFLIELRRLGKIIIISSKETDVINTITAFKGIYIKI